MHFVVFINDATNGPLLEAMVKLERRELRHPQISQTACRGGRGHSCEQRQGGESRHVLPRASKGDVLVRMEGFNCGAFQTSHQFLGKHQLEEAD